MVNDMFAVRLWRFVVDAFVKVVESAVVGLV